MLHYSPDVASHFDENYFPTVERPIKKYWEILASRFWHKYVS